MRKNWKSSNHWIEKKKLKGTNETNNYIVIYSGVNRSTRAQAGIRIWINKSIKNTIINYTCWSESIIEVKPNIVRANLSLFDSTPSRYSDWLRVGRSGDRIPVGARFSAPVQTDPEAHPGSCKMGTGSSPGVRCGRGVTLTPHPLLVPRSKIE